MPTLDRLRLAALIGASILSLPTFAKAQTVIASQSFEFESASSERYIHTDHGALPDGGDDGLGPDVNSSATGSIDSGYWGFSAALNDTRSTPADGGLSERGERVGVTDFTGHVSSFTDGVQGYQFTDTDDLFSLTFDTVDASGFDDITFSIDYFMRDGGSTGYESNDLFQIFINGVAVLDSTALPGPIENDFTIDSWVSFSYVIPSPTDVDVELRWDSNADEEALYIDNLKITSSVQQATGNLSLTPEFQILDEDDSNGYTLTVTLSTAAPVGGVDITLTASPAGAVTISSSGTQTIAESGTTADFTITPVATAAFMDVPVYFTATANTGYFDAEDAAALLSTNNDTYSPSVPAGYYTDSSGKAGQPLKDALHTIISNGHTAIPYSSGNPDVLDAHRVMFEDPFDTGNIILFYGGKSTGENDVWFPETTADRPWSREHLWPQSLGVGGEGDDYSDLHHLMPVLNTNNGTRGNKVFDDSNGGSAVDLLGASFGSKSFEPPDHHKGDVARALLYMAVRYDGLDSLTADLELAEDALVSNTMAVLSTLEQWHINDPVSDHERQRNDLIYGYQGNRNPFIDHPEYVDDMLNQPDNNGSEQVELIAGTAVGDVLRYNDGAGTSRVIYFNENDTPSAAPAFEDANWLPVTVTGTPPATIDVTASLGTVSYMSGLVLTVNNLPVYTYTGDSDGDDTNGDGINDEWWTLLADGSSNEPIITPSSATVLITQYYEGASNDKYLELTNVSNGQANLDGWKLTLWSNTATENWKTDASSPNTTLDLDGITLNAGDSYLIANSSAANPVYADTGADLNSGVTSFNGDDSIVLYNGAVAVANIVDALSFTDAGEEGNNKTIIRLNADVGEGISYDLIAGSDVLDFPAVWSVATYTVADSVASNEELYLGYSAITAVSAFDLYIAGFGLTGNDALSTADPDGDDLDNQGEFDNSTDPTLADTDGDGQSDGAEVTGWLTDPSSIDDVVKPIISITGTSVTVEWDSKLTLNYFIQENNDLTNPLGWSLVTGSTTAGTGSTASTTFTDTSTNKYYRLAISTAE